MSRSEVFKDSVCHPEFSSGSEKLLYEMLNQLKAIIVTVNSEFKEVEYFRGYSLGIGAGATPNFGGACPFATIQRKELMSSGPVHFLLSFSFFFSIQPFQNYQENAIIDIIMLPKHLEQEVLYYTH